MRAFSLTDSAFLQNTRHVDRLTLLSSFLYALRCSAYSIHSGMVLIDRARFSLCWMLRWAAVTSGVSHGGFLSVLLSADVGYGTGRVEGVLENIGEAECG